MNIFFYGINVVKNLIKFKYKYIKYIYLCKYRNDKKFLNIKFLAEKYLIKLNFVNKNYFNFLSNKNINHQNIIAFTEKNIFNFNKQNLFDILNRKKFLSILIVDRIVDPYNLGSCIRSAVAFGVDIILLNKLNCVSIYNNIVHKSSVGSIFKIKILQINNISNIIDILKINYFYYIIGTCLKSNNLLNNFKFNYSNFNGLVLILGSENLGVKKKLKEKCNILLKIPIKNINSLNVSVANGILLYNLLLFKNN